MKTPGCHMTRPGPSSASAARYRFRLLARSVRGGQVNESIKMNKGAPAAVVGSN